MRALLLSVGTGETVEDGIAFSINTYSPDAVFCLCTEMSREKLPLIRERMNHPESLVDPPCPVCDPADFDRTYSDCVAALERILQQGYKPSEILVDYTGGTKVMAAALVVAAAEAGVERFIYIDGPRGGPGMRVISSQEQARATAAGRLSARRDMRLAKELFIHAQWDAAISLARRAATECAVGPDHAPARALEALAECYRSWDRFLHAEAWQKLCAIGKTDADALGVSLDGNRSFLHMLGKTENEPCGDRGLALVADLLNNAARRGDQGEWDDALARLYRATELLAQVALLSRADPIDTSACRLEQVPESLRDEWRHRLGPDGVLKIGLHDAYRLLAALEDPLGRWYVEDRRTQNALFQRNQSILAHGFKPARDADARELLGVLREQLVALEPRSDGWMKQGAFVKLRTD